MISAFDRVKRYVNDLGLSIVKENGLQEILIVKDHDKGINNLMMDCEHPILIIEQFILKLSDTAKSSPHILSRFLQMNRNLVHGAFTLDDDQKSIIYRDTLQLTHLDYNELEGSINSLSLGLAEHGSELM